MEKEPFDQNTSSVPNDAGEIDLAGILDVPAIQSLMDDFFHLTQIGVAILDIQGTVLVATGWQDVCTKFHRIHPETARNCLESDTILSSGVEPGTFKIYRCKNHMWDMATPIIIGGKHLGNLFLGQFFFADEAPDRSLFRDQARKYGFDETEYLAALDRVPRWEKETVHRVMTFYSKFAQLISDLSYANVGLAKVVRERDALLCSLRESERQYRSLVEHSNDIIWEFDISSQEFSFASDAMERILGYPVHPAKKLGLDDIFSRETKKRVLTAFGDVWSGRTEGDRVVVEAEHRHHDGHGVWMEISATAIKDVDGKLVGFAGVTRDISERKRGDDALRQQESLLRQVIDAVPYPVFVKDKEGCFLLLNTSTADLFGASVKDVLGKKSTDFHFSEGLRETFKKDDLDVIESGRRRFISEEVFPDHSGNQRVMQTIKIPIRWPGLTEYAALGVSVDLTERKKAEALRERSAEELKWLFKSMFNAFVLFESVFDADGRFVSYRFVRINDAYERITGVKNEEVKGKTVHEVWPETESEWIKRYGEVAVTGISQTFDLYHDPTNKLYHCIVYRPWNTKERFCVIFEDITEQRRIETERAALEAQNRQLQKAKSLGRMAGAIAHHFNNHLQAVIGNLQLAIGQTPKGTESLESMRDALTAAQKAAGLSGQMLTYLGQTPAKREALELSDMCRQSLPMLREGLPRNVVLETDLPEEGPAVHANPNQMEQVLTNLMANAWEAMWERGGVILLAVKTVTPGDIPSVHRFPLDWQPEQSDYACLEVTDEGPGIAEQDLEKLFDPFFSTKFTGRGLGLPMVLGIVRAHGGCVTVESRLGDRRTDDRGRRAERGGLKSENLRVLAYPVAPEDGTGASLRENPVGSVFRVFLPLIEGEGPIPKEMPIAVGDTPQEAGTVLLVEDTEQVRKLGARMLEYFGWRVLAARDGMEGVAIFQERAQEIDFVLTDLTMPRMDGWETIAALRQIRADIPVILASGYDEASVMNGAHPEQPQVFLGKPYSIEDLRAAIGRVVRASVKAERPKTV